MTLEKLNELNEIKNDFDLAERNYEIIDEVLNQNGINSIIIKNNCRCLPVGQENDFTIKDGTEEFKLIIDILRDFRAKKVQELKSKFSNM